MNCISPPQLEDRQLLAALDGEGGASVAAHLEACPSCRARRDLLASQQGWLEARLFRGDCPSTIELGDYHLGLLPVARSVAIARHVIECPHCTREVAELRAYLVPLAPPQGDGLLEDLKVLVARWLGAPKEGGLAAPGLAVLRGGAPGPLTLEADGILLLLDIQPGEAGALQLLGQVAAPDQDRWTGAAVELRRDGGLQGQAAVDDLGAFRLSGLSPGLVDLQLLPPGGPLVVAHFELAV